MNKKYIKGSHPKKEDEANYNWEGGKIVTYYLLPQSHYQLARIHSLSSFYSQVTSAKTKPHLFQINYQIKDLNFVGMCILQINFQNEYSVEISLVSISWYLVATNPSKVQTHAPPMPHSL